MNPPAPTPATVALPLAVTLPRPIIAPVEVMGAPAVIEIAPPAPRGDTREVLTDWLLKSTLPPANTVILKPSVLRAWSETPALTIVLS